MSAQTAVFGVDVTRILSIALFAAIGLRRRRANENDSVTDRADYCDSRISKGEFVVSDLNILVPCGTVLV